MVPFGVLCFRHLVYTAVILMLIQRVKMFSSTPQIKVLVSKWYTSESNASPDKMNFQEGMVRCLRHAVQGGGVAWSGGATAS